MRSSTAIGALVREAEHAESRPDFTPKMSIALDDIALKEANETLYWLELLHASEYLDRPAYESIAADSEEVLRLLVAIVKASRRTPDAN
ncbi:MAG: four helix bundle protein [Chloracidobacterium sp.]|uniref:four helix bundle protein n=1 Tax=Chloracidobacterium validum TaxID=2821543 RepID=UPI0031B8A2F8